MRLTRINLFGCAWEPADTSIAPPVVYGDPRRDFDADCLGVRIGVVATQPSAYVNAWKVEPAPDAVFVERLPGERYYAGAAPSLMQRVASLHGTAQAWSLEYR